MAALYLCCQAWPPSSSLQSGRVTDILPPVCACSPRRAFYPAASALLAPHTHPSCLVGLSNPGFPTTLLPPFIVLHPSTSSLSPPPLHWACEGEPVPSGATVQIAMRPPQMVAALLWIHSFREWLACFSSSSSFIFCSAIFICYSMLTPICPSYLVYHSFRSIEDASSCWVCHLKARLMKHKHPQRF